MPRRPVHSRSRRSAHRRAGLATAVAIAAAATGALSGPALATPTPRHAPSTSTRSLSVAERAAIGRARPRPPRVTDLAPYRDGRLVTLGWHNPDAALFRRVIVRYEPGGSAPRTPGQGTVVRVGSPRASSVTLRHLRQGAQYTAAVWTRDAMGRLSPRTATAFVVPMAPRRSSATLAGRMTDAAGHALSGVIVSLADENDGQTVATTVTGSDGRYLLDAFAAPYEVDVDGSNGAGGDSDESGYLGRYRLVTLVPHRRTTYDAALNRGAAVVGRVTDDSGNPLGGIDAGAEPAWNYVSADVNDFGFAFDDLAQQVTTDANGNFALKGLYPDSVRACFDPNDGTYYPTDVGFGYSQQCAETPHQLHRGQIVDIGSVPLATTPRGAVTGRVTNRAGTGIAGVAVTARLVGRRYAVGYVETGPHGGYRLGGLKPGTYRLCADSSGTTPGSRLGYLSRCRTRTVGITASAVARDRRIVLSPGGAISGVVRAANGAPVVGASVTLGNDFFSFTGALTDAHGRWTISGLRSGRYPICVDASSAAVRGMPFGVVSACTGKGRRALVRRGQLRIGADRVLATGAAIRGVARSAGKPVSGEEVDTGFGGADPGRQADVLTDRHGRFVLRGLEAGSYRLCFFDGWANDVNRQSCSDRRVTTRAGHASRYGTAKLPATGSIDVQVTDASARPLNGVDVAVLTPCRHILCDRSPLIPGRFRVAASWTTYGDGSVTLRGFAPRAYAVCEFGYLAAPARGETPLTGYVDRCTPGYDVHVRGGKVTTITSSLALAGEITGTVTTASGEPLAGAQLHITGSAVDDVPRQILTVYDDPTEPGSITDADGTYAVRSIEPGDSTVCVDPSAATPGDGYEWQCLGASAGAHHGGTPVTVAPGQVTVGVNVSVHR